jgi:feruloyl esterase
VGPEPFALGVETYRVLVHADPTWDYRTFDVERDIARAKASIGPVMNSTDPDLAPFFARGGKLLLYHGWNDPGISPFNTIDYFDAVRTTVPETATDAGLRLFMVPGMNHCRGGVGTDTFDTVAALDRWVTGGQAPARIEATKEQDGNEIRSRPLCAYPRVAAYGGSGDTNDTANFVCRGPMD